MYAYVPLFVLGNIAAGYACLRLGRRSWNAAVLFLIASTLWFALILIQHFTLIEIPMSRTNPVVGWIIGSAFVPLLGSAVATWIQLRQRRFVDTLRAGRCLRCGYDLRFVKRSICPECGCRV